MKEKQKFEIKNLFIIFLRIEILAIMIHTKRQNMFIIFDKDNRMMNLNTQFFLRNNFYWLKNLYVVFFFKYIIESFSVVRISHECGDISKFDFPNLASDNKS